MIRLLFALSLVFSALNVFPENNKPVADVEILSREIMAKDSLIKSLFDENKSLARKESIESVALNANTNLFNGISVWLTIVAILLTLFAIGAPILNYFLVIKPNRKGIKKLKTIEKNVIERVEKNFENYMADFEKRKVKKMIANLKEPKKIWEAIDYLKYSSYTAYDEEDLNGIITCLKSNSDLSDSQSVDLNSIVFSKENIISENYYRYVLEEAEKNPDKYNLSSAVTYFVSYGFEKRFSYLKMIILSKNMDYLSTFLKSIYYLYLDDYEDGKISERSTNGRKYIEMLLNDKDICDKAGKGTYRNGIIDLIPLDMFESLPFLKDTLLVKNENEKYKVVRK